MIQWLGRDPAGRVFLLLAKSVWVDLVEVHFRDRHRWLGIFYVAGGQLFDGLHVGFVLRQLVGGQSRSRLFTATIGDVWNRIGGRRCFNHCRKCF